jgi:hypothetical protein
MGLVRNKNVKVYITMYLYTSLSAYAFIRKGRIIYTKVNRIIPCKIIHFFRISSCFDIDLLSGIIEVIPRGMNIRVIILIYRPKMDIQNPGCKKTFASCSVRGVPDSPLPSRIFNIQKRTFSPI